MNSDYPILRNSFFRMLDKGQVNALSNLTPIKGHIVVVASIETFLKYAEVVGPENTTKTDEQGNIVKGYVYSSIETYLKFIEAMQTTNPDWVGLTPTDIVFDPAFESIVLDKGIVCTNTQQAHLNFTLLTNEEIGRLIDKGVVIEQLESGSFIICSVDEYLKYYESVDTTPTPLP